MSEADHGTRELTGSDSSEVVKIENAPFFVNRVNIEFHTKSLINFRGYVLSLNLKDIKVMCFLKELLPFRM